MTHTLWGAEQQAATSFALAYPERDFRFVSSVPVVDGWDLANVTISAGTRPGGESPRDLPLCPSWLSEALPLSSSLTRLAEVLGDQVAPVTMRPPRGSWIAKGDRWHRPNGRVHGAGEAEGELVRGEAEGLVFQQQLVPQATVLAVGCRRDQTLAWGLFQVLREALGRQEFLIAAESIREPELEALSAKALEHLGHQGLFTLTWVLTEKGPRLTSFRPIPRALIGCLRAGQIDVLEPNAGLLQAGFKMIADYHYSSYQALG